MIPIRSVQVPRTKKSTRGSHPPKLCGVKASHRSTHPIPARTASTITGGTSVRRTIGKGDTVRWDL